MKLTKERAVDTNFELYTFANQNGVELSVTNLGAAITRLVVPDKNGQPVDVMLGYRSLERYQNNTTAHGATVGRCANRIGKAAFELGGKVYELDKNDGRNSLHGGFDKYFNRLWQAEAQHGEKPSVTFRLLSPDGDQGMPGNAQIAVTFSLTEANEVILQYDAMSDQDTVFNLTNHAYFNLAGHDFGSITEHILRLDCDYFTPVDSEFIPTGEIRAVKGTVMDFTTPKAIGLDIDSDYEQVVKGLGFDHNYVINRPGPEQPFAQVSSPQSGIVMEVFTDLPGVQFYSGNFMGKDDEGKGQAEYVQRGAFCLETQYFPDSPNKPDFPVNVFKAHEPLHTTTVYKFSVK